MNSEAISAIISKHPALKASKAKLEAMEPGAYVVHRSWGFGQIKSYDDADQKLGNAANDAELARVGIASPSFYLLRPDGHIALCGRQVDAGTIARYLEVRLRMLATAPSRAATVPTTIVRPSGSACLEKARSRQGSLPPAASAGIA